MEWTCDTGELVTWGWAESEVDAPEQARDGGDRYPISIRLDGRRLRGAEAKRWRHRIEAEYPAESGV